MDIEGFSFFKKHLITTSYAGHPLIESCFPKFSKEDFYVNFNLKNTRIIGLLPGSRIQEVQAILPAMLKSLPIINKQINIQVVLGASENIPEKLINDMVAKSPVKIIICSNLSHDVIKFSDFILTASGTATLETAYLGTPMAVLYKVTFITWLIAKIVIKLPYIGLVNIVAGKKIVPEFIQYHMKPEKISEYVINLLNDHNKYKNVLQDLKKVAGSLGEGKPSQELAKMIINYNEKNLPENN